MPTKKTPLTIKTSCVILSNSYKKFAEDNGCCREYIKILVICSDRKNVSDSKRILSPTLCVDRFGGGAFLLKSASEMSSYGSVSSFRMVKRGLSHRFLESGASNLNTKASKLQKRNHRKRNQEWASEADRERLALEPGPLAHMSWLYFSAASLPMFHDELSSSDVKQYTYNRSRMSREFTLLSLKFGYFKLQPSRMLTRQWGVCACLMRQKNSYL